MLSHILILCHITLNFCGQFSICVSFDENGYFLSDAYLEHLRYVAEECGWYPSEFSLCPWLYSQH